ncbi:protein CLN8-like [Lingula anatina]|uniref:Protein CLN8-like n=1 Tax=Lingula anatina TaxID=7574 RepID=A0A1S3K5C2_LINAN|nr:protein CLN8-like [Lingula anatina]|eukprot:XP_013417461.1 protein CLN8-like [Lingula anatina]
MGFVGNIHPSLETLDYTSTRVQLEIIGLSFLFFLGIYILSASLAALTWTYRNLRLKEKIFWNLSVVRAVFGVYAVCSGAWALWWDTEMIKDVVHATTPTSWFTNIVSIGFFLFECSAILFCDLYFRQGNMLLNLHHMLALTGCVMVLRYRSIHYFWAIGVALEMSTPFSALCWILLKCGRANTFLWKANQYVLVHVFHCRSILETFLWIQSFRHWENIWAHLPWPVFVMFFSELALVTFVMTPYWTYKKTEQLIIPRDWNFEDSEDNKRTNGSLKKED